MRKRRLLLLLLVVAGSLLVAWAWASQDRCGDWPAAPPGLVSVARAQGALQAGAARTPLAPRLPATVGGYGPPRSTADGVDGALSARALYLDVGGQGFALLLLDVLLVPAPVVEAVRAGRDFPVWVLATHAHSSLGGYDKRLVAEVAALGAFDDARERELVAAAGAALDAARAAAAPARLELAATTTVGLTAARSGGDADEHLTRARFVGADGAAIAEWLILSAHPTLVQRRTTRLDGDWPARLAASLETGRTVAFVTQGAGGNASARVAEGEDASAFATRVRAVVDAVAPAGAPETVDFGYASARLPLPHPDGSRLAPAFLRAAAENALCDDVERDVELAALRLGPLGLLAAPVEPSGLAGRFLEEQAGAARVLGLANGYVGYVEFEEAVRGPWGESNKQYFGPGFLGRLGEAARLAGAGAGLRAK